MTGRVQLSRNVSPLHKNFRRDKVQADMKKAVKQPESIDAPPMEDTSSEDEQQSQQNCKDSSDDDVFAGNIRRTTFKARTKSKPAIAAGSSHGRGKEAAGMAGRTPTRRSIRQPGIKKRTKDDIDDDDADRLNSTASKKTKTDSDELARHLGGHMSFGIMDSKQSDVKRGYGKKSQQSTPRLQFPANRPLSDPNSSPEKETKFKSGKFRALGSSPVATLKLSHPFKAEDGEPSPLVEFPTSEELSDPPRAVDSHQKKQKPTRRSGKKGRNKTIEIPLEPVSQQPQFKMPHGYNNYAESAALVNLDVALNENPEETKSLLDPGTALCPMCGEQVDEDLLKEFSNGERMKLVRQVKFCRLHKKLTAQKTWAERGYPVVDWAGLEARIEGHQDLLKSIIMGAGSHFGDLLTENIRKGQARTLLTTDEYLTPGYYGLRGMSVMTEAVTDRFSTLLRQRAPIDTRISGRGYTGFVQSVLVPELAVKLIQEDLSLGEDQARNVMKESRVVGETLNDEKRQSQSQARRNVHGESQEEKDAAAKQENSDRTDGDALVDLKIEQAADSVSDLSSPPSYSQRPTSIRPQSQDFDDTDSDGSLQSLGGITTKKDLASTKKQDGTISPGRPSSRSRDNKDPASVTMEVDDSDGLSSLHSF